MRIFVMPCWAPVWGATHLDGHILICRQGARPKLFMRNVVFTACEASRYYGDFRLAKTGICICGAFTSELTFQDLQEDDQLIVTTTKPLTTCALEPFYQDMHTVGDDLMLPFQAEKNPLAIAARLENSPKIVFMTLEMKDLWEKSYSLYEKAQVIYNNAPAYKQIMLRTGGQITPMSLMHLASIQPQEKHEALMALFMSVSTIYKSERTIAKRILDNCVFEDGFSLLTQEEQVETFIEFSKITAGQKKELVSDTLLQNIENSPEYEAAKEKLRDNGLGISKTQQFNVLQQVGYLSVVSEDRILYNLSDMGAGKTLMTVEAIFMLDLKQISTWIQQKETIIGHMDGFEVMDLYLPDKHIIAPTLSVKSSWIDTFRLFYDVTDISDTEYQLSVEYQGLRVASKIYVSPFTVKDGKVFVKTKLPETEDNTYLIIDEIHQLVKRNIAKTKFFPAKTTPKDIYQCFILSGTMSNLKTAEWFYFMRFIGLPVVEDTQPSHMKTRISEMLSDGYTGIENSVSNIRSEQHRYFDAPDMTKENTYFHELSKKQTSTEEEFFLRYGSHILVPKYISSPVPVEKFLNSSNRYEIMVDPAEADNINFELFYKVVGSSAVTAQSVQVAEELFGEQKKQHVSDIIKTVSPLSKSDIHLLKTLHHIAEDHNQYKSPTIAKHINNAILNLNDGLQTKNIYDIVSGYAEKNLRFFEYLATLDINILEQLPKSGLIEMPELTKTDKFKVLQDILQREKEETHLIVVNDYYALKALSDALGIDHLTKDQLKRELDYQDTLDALFEKQSVVIVTQDMIKSSLDLIQANRLIQYQLNTEISDIIQTQNRINRIGQTRETRGYYIASDQLQENLIELFLESYRNIRVAHKGIVELFTDITSQINVVNDYLERAFATIEQSEGQEPEMADEMDIEPADVPVDVPAPSIFVSRNVVPEGAEIAMADGVSRAILYPQNGAVTVLVPLTTGCAFPLGQLAKEEAEKWDVSKPKQVMWNAKTEQIFI